MLSWIRGGIGLEGIFGELDVSYIVWHPSGCGGHRIVEKHFSSWNSSVFVSRFVCSKGVVMLIFFLYPFSEFTFFWPLEH